MRIVTVVAVGGLTLAAAACGNAPSNTPGGGSTSAAATYTACMVTDQGGLDDKSFNASAWKGMEAARDDPNTNVVVKNVPSTAEAQYEPNLTSFVNQKCDFILAVGGLMGDATKKVALANPKQQFAIVDANPGKPAKAGDPGVPNIYPMQFDTAQAAFVAGYLAAGTSTTKKVGTYGGLKIPPVTIFMDGFADGVAYYNQQKNANVQVLGWDKAKQDGLFANTFVDQAKGKSLSDTLHAQGADVIMPVAGGTGLGTTQDAATGKFKAIWVDTDGCVSTNYCAGLVTSVQKNIADAVKDAVLRGANKQSLALADGTIGTLANNGVGIAPYHDFDSKIDAGLKADVAKVQADIKSGAIKVTSPSQPTNA